LIHILDAEHLKKFKINWYSFELMRHTHVTFARRMSTEYHVASWADLQDKLFSNTYDDALGRHRSPFIYRGMNDANKSLKTSLARLGGPYEELERHLLRNFKKYAHTNVLSGQSNWNWLALAQHHGLPSRLLDWTYSPYVALHFATNDLQRYNQDGVIWVLNYVKLNQYLPQKLKAVMDKEQSNTFTADMLDKVCKTLEELDELAKESFLLFLEPPSLDDRIVNQFALFSLLSSSTQLLDDWLEEHDQYCDRVIIPKELKWEIRDKLDQANITERVLFPGLDGLSQWLKRQYSSKQSEEE